MKVYRFENADGVGPFRTNACMAYDDAQRTRNRRHSARDMPSPYCRHEEGTPLAEAHHGPKRLSEKRFSSDYLFGFLTLAQIRSAFPSRLGREAMCKYGMNLVVYEVDPKHVLQGTAQCAFRKRHADKLYELDPRTLDPIQSRNPKWSILTCK